MPIDKAAAPLFGKPDTGWRSHLYTVIFEADTRAGKQFDIALLVVIVLSVMTVILESVPQIRAYDFHLLAVLEWVFTLMFTAEYVLRLICVKRPLRYACSFFGLIDLLSILPSYVALFIPGTAVLVDIRLLRLLRVFRVLKLPRYFDESQILLDALRSSRRKIAIFIGAMCIIAIILGTVMYVVEGPENGYTSIPVSMYWAVVTLTTTGYGDIHPHTALGQFITSMAMLLGYGIIALPTGIVGAELALNISRRRPATPASLTTRTCRHCLTEGHEANARYCKDCGEPMAPHQSDSVRFQINPPPI